MTTIAPDQLEVLRAEPVEALARMVNRVIAHGKTEMRSAIDQIEVICTSLIEAARMEDFVADLEVAERTLLPHLLT